MNVFYDPSDLNQIQALYTEDTKSTAWNKYTKISIDDPILIKEISKHGRDCCLDLDGKIIKVIQRNHPVDHSLEKEKINKCNAIDSKTKILIFQGFLYNQKTFSLSGNAQLKISLLLASIGRISYPVPISASDQSVFFLSNTTALQSWVEAAYDRLAEILTKGAELKQQYFDSTSQSELDAIMDNRT